MVSRRRFLAALGAAALAGCGRPASERGAKTLVFKHGKLFGDPRALRALIDEFESAHPGVAVHEETLPASSDEQHQFYAINLQARSRAFDVLALDIIWVAGFARAGWLSELGALEPGTFFDGPAEAVTWQGKAYALPWFVDAGLLYYRRDLLEKRGLAPPETWQDLVRIAREVAPRAPGTHGFVWQGKQYEGLVCNALEYLHSNGGAVLAEGRVVLDSPQNREALGLMADLVHRYGVTPASVTTATEEPSRHVFGQGRALFLRNWPYAWRLFQDPSSRVHGSVGIAALPRFPGGRSAPTLGGWQLAVNAASSHQEEAAALVRFLTGEKAQRQLALAYGFQPARTALYRDAELLATQPFVGQLARVFAAARPRPVTPQYVRVSQVLQSGFSAALSGRRTPQAALAHAHERIEEILDAA
ncbi:MAG TPA: ABC transporter substrate-binding protein [Burkholderiales bacterium]|nr:ABC transporter substrate-binding protein [Burkholderiales bacterium]